MGAIRNVDPQTYAKMTEAMDYRLQGWTYETIAAVMGISISYAAKLVKNGLKGMVKEKADDLRKLELKRLDKLWNHAYSGLVTTPEVPGVVNKDALDACLKVMKRRAELLGLDMPVRIEAKVDANVNEQVQFYMPSNGRDVQPADVVMPAVPALAFESPAYDEDEDEAD